MSISTSAPVPAPSVETPQRRPPPAPVRAVEKLQAMLAQVGWRGVAARVALLLGLAAAAAAIHVPRPATLCPLRALTGIPCPICGSTTAAVELGHGDVVGALRANPIAVVLGALWVLGPLGVSRWWWSMVGRRHLVIIGTLALVAWVWQLFRFGLI